MLTAGHAMQTEVEVVSSDTSLVGLEWKLLSSGRSGFPVVDDGTLVGIVSRSDVVRQLAAERNAPGQRADFYRAFEDPDGGSQDETEGGRAMAGPADSLSVADAMIRQVVTVDRDQPLSEVARLLLDGHIHRLPVVEKGELVGIVTTLDVVRLFAEGRLVEAGLGDGTAKLPRLEEQLSPDELRASIRAQLEERRDRLLGRSNAIERDLRSAHHADSGERAVERENDEVLERLGDSQRRQLAQVQKAIARIDAGSYETCEACGGPVGADRQAALPESTRCRACA